jgi:hypothetical protein
MGNSLFRKRPLELYSAVGETPEEACKNLEEILIKVTRSAIVTLGPENLAPMIASPRPSTVNRVCLATINGKQCSVKITKEPKSDGKLQYAATVRF